MPHYLARVAAAATRMTTAARPPVAAPPLMPGPGLAGAMSPPAPISEDAWNLLDAANDAPAPLNAPADATPPNAPPMSAGENLMPSNRPAQMPAPMPLPSNQDSSPAPGALGSMARTVETLLHGAEQATRIQAPRALRPAQAANPPLPETSQEARPLPTQPAAPQAGARAEAPAPLANERAQERQTPAMPIAPSGVRTAPLSPAQIGAREPTPGGSGKRQSRITIGQIDVQVHNRPPAPITARPTQAASPITSDSLEQRYLDRFRLKP